MNLKIVTPEGIHWQGEIDSVVLPGIEGEMEILPGHIALATRILAGELVVKEKKTHNSTFLAVGDGFVEVTPTDVTVLSDMAVNAENIDEAAALAAQAKAQERLKQKISQEEVALAIASLSHAAAMLKVKRRR